MSAAAPTKVSVFRPPFRPVETPSFESGKPVCPQARRQDRAPRAFSNLTAPGLQSLQAHGPAAIDSEYTPLRKTILAQSLCVNVWCCVNVAIKLFILQWVGSLSCSGLCQECTKQKLHRVWRLRHNLINHISEFILCQQFFDLYVAFTCSPDAALGIIIRNDSERAPSPRCLSTHCNIAIRLPLLGVAEGCHFFGF
jgi:hypothetical protein